MRIAIIGLGLIGGSWGLALREWAKTEEGRTTQLELVGFDAKGKQRTLADKMGICDRYTPNPMEAVKDADVVIVATPVLAVRETFEDIAEHLKPGAIVTDTCSTKRRVMDWSKELLPRTVSFVGGHPMAGKTLSLEGANATMFKGATYCLVASPYSTEEALENVVHMVEVVGAKPYFLDASEHDSYVASVSHLPHLAAVALTNLVGDSDGWREISRLASTGFQDTTRLAGGNVPMYLDICRTNADSILSWLDRYQAQLSDLRTMIEQASLVDEGGRPRLDSISDPGALEQYLDRARETRERWEISRTRTDFDQRNEGVQMPSKQELRTDYSRMIFGGLFSKRKRPDDSGNPPK